jgi:hypothetical protein
VPKNGTNHFIAVITPKTALNSLQFVSSLPGVATVGNQVPGPPAGNSVAVLVAVNGVAHSPPPNATIDAMTVPPAPAVGPGKKLTTAVNVTVKNPQTKTLAIFEADDPRDDINKNNIPLPRPPTVQQLQDFFVNVFQRQAAITLNVQPLVHVNVQWDDNSNGTMPNPNNPGQNQIAEYNKIITNAAFANVQADYKIVFVDAIEPIANALAGDTDTLGFSLQGSNVAVVSTFDVNNVPNGDRPLSQKLLIAAHELGHAMGLTGPALPNNGHNPLPNHLMTASLAQNPNYLYELDKYEWDALNP